MRLGFVTPWLTVRLRLPSWPRRFSFGTLLCLVAVVAVLLAWRRDRVQLESQVATLRGELMRRDKANASWGVEQLLGEPDTTSYGDVSTSWASSTQDDKQEWIIAEYAEEARPQSVEVYETYNPGALTKVSIFDPLGREVVVWTGQDPTQPPAQGGVSKIAVSTIWSTKKVKIYLDSAAVPGWNEIDTIGLRDQNGTVHWPINATASSSYGGRDSQRGLTPAPSSGGMVYWDTSVQGYRSSPN